MHPTVGYFGATSLPWSLFTNFTDDWDDATGNPVHSCEERSEYCPDAATLRNMRTMSIWADAIEGEVHLEVKSITGYDCTAAAKTV